MSDPSSLRIRIRTVRDTGVAGRVALEFLAATNAVLFHGTDRPNLRTLHPQQPPLYDAKRLAMMPHGKRAIHATAIVDLAIFFALTRLSDVKNRLSQYVWGFDVVSDTIKLSASIAVIDEATADGRAAWVYVLDRRDFRQRDAAVYTSRRPVRPLLAVRVSGADFPSVIVAPDDLRIAS